MTIEQLITSEDVIELSVCKTKSGNYYLAFISYFSEETSVGTIKNYIDTELVTILTKEGNIELFQLKSLESVQPLFALYDLKEFKKRYKKVIQKVGLAVSSIEVTQIYKYLQDKTDAFQIRNDYRKAYEKLFRDRFKEYVKDIKPLWYKEEVKC